MRDQNEGIASNLKEFVCGIVVLVFAILGLAKLADWFDQNISSNVIYTASEQTSPNKGTSNAGVRIV